MITIENRSAFFVTVPKHSNLDRTFAYHCKKEFEAYVAELSTAKHKPVLSRGDSNYAVRVRALGHRNQCIKAKTYQEAIDIKDQMDVEHRKGLFIDYAKGRSVTFGDLLARYLCEVSPRHKGFEVEGYIINAILVDSGLPRVDIEKAYLEHKNPHPSLAKIKFRKPTCVFHGNPASNSTRNRPPIPRQSSHRFHGNPATHSMAIRPPVPRQSGHLIRDLSDGQERA